MMDGQVFKDKFKMICHSVYVCWFPHNNRVGSVGFALCADSIQSYISREICLSETIQGQEAHWVALKA